MIYIGGQEENCEKILEGKNMPWSDIIHSSLYIFNTIILRINNVSKGKYAKVLIRIGIASLRRYHYPLGGPFFSKLSQKFCPDPMNH